MARPKNPNRRRVAKEVLQDAIDAKAGNVIVIGTTRGGDYLNVSPATNSRDEVDAIIDQVKRGIVRLRKLRAALPRGKRVVSA